MSPIDEHVARVAECRAKIEFGVPIRQAPVSSGGPKYLRMTPQIELVVESLRQWSDPTTVPVTDREVCWQVAVDRFADSFAGHTSSAERTAQILL